MDPPRPSYLLNTNYIPPSELGDFDENVIRRLSTEFALAEKSSTHGEKIKTYLRIRPNKFKNKQPIPLPLQSQVFVIEDEFTLCVRSQKNFECETRYNYSRIFNSDASQSTVFDESVRGVLDAFLDEGENGLVFSYGATNSGKTYTMQGSGKEFGIVPRTLYLLFTRLEDSLYKKGDIKPHPYDGYVNLDQAARKNIQDIKERVVKSAKIKPRDMSSFVDSFVLSSSSFGSASTFDGDDHLLISSSYETLSSTDGSIPDKDTIYSVWVSFAEIYNEKVYDLFDTIERGKRRRELKVLQDKQNRVYIKDLTECYVNSAEEAYLFFLAGKKNLQFSATNINSNSSRSHCFFNIRMVSIGRAGNHLYPKEVHSFSFCDLAGLERVSQTGNIGLRLKESGNINQSLLVLLKCIRGLRDQQIGSGVNGEVFSFRESKLTRIFQSYLQSTPNISMIVNINPDPKTLDSSIQVIANSAIASTIRTFKKPEPPKAPMFHLGELNGQVIHTDDEESYEEDDQNQGEASNFPPTVKRRSDLELENIQLKRKNESLENENSLLKRKLEDFEWEIRKQVGEQYGEIIKKQREFYKEQMKIQRQDLELSAKNRLEVFASYAKSGLFNESDDESEIKDGENVDPNQQSPKSFLQNPIPKNKIMKYFD